MEESVPEHHRYMDDAKRCERKIVHCWRRLEYCARSFGESAATDFIKSTDAKIERICKFPESGTREPLLNEEEMVYRYVLIQKHIKLIYRFENHLTNCEKRIIFAKK